MANARLPTGTLRVRAYHALGELLEGTTSLPAAAPAIAALLMELTGAAGSSVTRVDGRDVVYVAAAGIVAGYLGRRRAVAGSFTGGVVESGRAALFQLDAAAPGTSMRATAARIRCGVVAPIASGGQVVGTLGLAGTRADSFGPQHVSLLGDLASFVGVSLHS